MLTCLCLSTTDWDAPQFGSRQQIALQLVARGYQVLFVEVPRALHSLISDPHGTFRAMRRLGRLRQVPGGPVVYTPPPVLPVYYHPLVNAFNQRFLFYYLRHVLKRLGWQLDILWTYWPHTASLVGRLGERVAVYHCIDALTAVSYPLVAPGTIARMEAELCRRVDLIFARTEGLTMAKQEFNPHTYFLPGGVDPTLFHPAQIANPPADIAALPRPRIGFIGTLDDRLDVDLLGYCARNLPAAAFVLVGPMKRHLINLGPLQNLPNVFLRPACPHPEVPAVIAGFDVGLIPYRANPYTDGLSPLKLYEYLAMGKPVVATDLPYLRREADHIRLAHTPDAFLAAIHAALAHPPAVEEQSCWYTLAKAHSWERQVDAIERRLKELLSPVSS